MGALVELERLEMAVALLRRRARVSIAHHETGVPREKLRTLHWEIHGRGAPCGQLPALGGAAIQTRARQVQAGIFAGLYQGYIGPGTRSQGDIRALIAAYDLYRVMAVPRAELDFTNAWVIARDLRVGTSQLRYCASCEAAYLVASASRLAPTCPFCALYRGRGRQATARMVIPAVAPGSDPDAQAPLQQAEGDGDDAPA